MATMNVILPGASANTGVKASATLPEGKYEFEITNAIWDDSKFASDQMYTLKLEGVYQAAPDDKLVGRKGTRFLNYRQGDEVEDWMKENDMTDIVAVFHAAGLVIKNDKLPIDKLVGKVIGFDLKHVAKKNDPDTVYANVTAKGYYSVAAE